jgi:tetratricopeptide (TPR) repeat protein
MAYVRARGSQVLIVHGERDPVTQRVAQRILFTIYSKAEAREALADMARAGGRFGSLLESANPGLRFDWKRIAKDLRPLLPVLPEAYDVREERVRSRFRHGLRAFAREVMQADPQHLMPSAELIREHQQELAFIADLIGWRLKLCEQKESEWNKDTPFYWRFESAARQVPSDVEERAAGLWERRDLDRAEAAFRLMVDCFEGYAEGHNYLGLIALERGGLDHAIDSFRKTMDLGRRLFPKRIARKNYWHDLETRPYMRGMRNLALALNRAGHWDEALAVCDRLEQECDDRISAMAHRSSVYLNTGRWAEAAGAALYLHQLSPTASLVAAFALFELNRQRETLAWFLHGALNSPRAARMLLGLRDPRPRSRDEAEAYNTGVDLQRDLHAYLRGRRRTSLRFLGGVAAQPDVAGLLEEVEAVVDRWRQQHRTGDREAFERMNLMHTMQFAHEGAREIADRLGLPEDASSLPEGRRRRSRATPAPAVH